MSKALENKHKLSGIVSDTPDALVEFREGTNGNVIVVHPDANDVASDLAACTISGGGNQFARNLIGYTESKDIIVGDGAENEWTTTFTVTSSADLFVALIRADNVFVDIRTSADIVIDVNGYANVTYPRAGHFVNDAVGGTEGTNPYVLSTQKLWLTRITKVEATGTGSNYSGILYGYDNIIQTGVMQSVSGAHSRINAGDHNTVFGGSYHRIAGGSYGAIYGGTFNEIGASGTGGIIIGGNGNTTSGSGPGFILGGSANRVSAAYATALGGANNNVSGNGATVGGRENTVSGRDALVGGYGHTVAGTYTSASGLSNIGSGAYALVGGRGNTASGESSFAVGRDNLASALGATASGRDAAARYTYGRTIAATYFAAQGDAQTSDLLMRKQTTDATPAEMLVAGTARLSLPNDSTFAFRIMLVARRTDANDESAAYEFKGCIDRNANAASTALVGSVTKTVLAEDTAAWDADVTADTTNGALKLTVTGEAAKTINWVARVELVEVTG